MKTTWNWKQTYLYWVINVQIWIYQHTHTRTNMHTTERSSHNSISMYICQYRYVLCRRILQLTFKRQRVTQTQCWTLLLSTKRADVNIVIKITLKKLVELANQMVMWTYIDAYMYMCMCIEEHVFVCALFGHALQTQSFKH